MKNRDEILVAYSKGLRNFVGVELDAIIYDFQGCCFDGADFSIAYITADFRNASLIGSTFVDANVKTCDFREANLTGANFNGAALCDTEFNGAKLDQATFDGAYCHGHTFVAGELPTR